MGCNTNSTDGTKFKLRKTISLPSDGPTLNVGYHIEAAGNQEASAIFAPEINLGSLADETLAGNFRKCKNIKSDHFEVSYGEKALSVSLQCPGATAIWVIPVRTVSLSEEGFESNLQGISVLPNYPIDLESKRKVFNTSIELRVQSN